VSTTGRRASRAATTRRLGLTAAVAATLTISTGIAALAAARPATPGSVTPGSATPGSATPGSATPGSATRGSATRSVPAAVAAVKRAGSAQAPVPVPARLAAARPLVPRRASAAASGPAALVLTAADRRDCPAAAIACVDLTRRITWLQAGGKVSFGPVRMEPGKPGTVHATPRGTFNVSWKSGPHSMSSIYHEPMPWATFFAAGGIAFHGGSLTRWSHGCVHLTVANAHHYQETLPIGAEVVVF
jgi:lipoprotein-anchoring transpeptidase ErfK/SrfK